MELLGSYEFQPTEEFMKSIKGVACDPEAWSQPICENSLLIMAGLGTDQVNKVNKIIDKLKFIIWCFQKLFIKFDY